MNRKLYSLNLINDEKLMTFTLDNFEVQIIHTNLYFSNTYFEWP